MRGWQRPSPFLCAQQIRVPANRSSPRSKIVVAFTCYLGVSGKDLTTHNGVLFSDSQVRLGDISQTDQATP